MKTQQHVLAEQMSGILIKTLAESGIKDHVASLSAFSAVMIFIATDGGQEAYRETAIVYLRTLACALESGALLPKFKAGGEGS